MTQQLQRGLQWLVGEFDALDRVLDESSVRRLMCQADLNPAEVAHLVEPNATSYARRTVVRRENYEILVLTWTPGQASPAHDHSGSLCGLKVVQGQLTEQLFEPIAGGYVRKTTASQLHAGGLTLDPGVVVHALGNDPASKEVLVTVHVYSPPLPEIRRYAVSDRAPADAFLRQPSPAAKVIAVIGGGFTGTMTLANLVRTATESRSAESESTEPLHFVLIDRQPAIGDGVAYRTNDARHLLNVPAARMSAWPDRPDDFLTFARTRFPTADPHDFLPRKIYGQYLRQTLTELAHAAPKHISIEILRDEATTLAPSHPSPAPGHSRWTVHSHGGRQIQADLAIITVGHRPPDDPFVKRWTGPRARFVADPWAALVISQIAPTDPVLLLGSGLTAVDAILSLSRPDRTAPIHVVSRRGLFPSPHLRDHKPPADVTALLAQLLDPATPLTIRALVAAIRSQIAAAKPTGTDWRQVIDGLRPALGKLWQRLAVPERARFLRHVRPFWEVSRHRMAPDVADTLARLQQQRLLIPCAGSFSSASAHADDVHVTIAPRDCSPPQNLRVAWVINCTGPGVQNRHSTHPVLRPLIDAGTLAEDPLGLGLLTDPAGRAISAGGDVHSSLLIAGTLRKATLWESTAVPELRLQAQIAAQTAITAITQ